MTIRSTIFLFFCKPPMIVYTVIGGLSGINSSLQAYHYITTRYIPPQPSMSYRMVLAFIKKGRERESCCWLVYHVHVLCESTPCRILVIAYFSQGTLLISRTLCYICQPPHRVMYTRLGHGYMCPLQCMSYHLL